MMSCLEFDDTRNDKRCIVNLLSKYIKEMKAETKIMYQRLEALQLAEELGNVSRVCREGGESHPLSSMNTVNGSENKALKD